MEEALLSVRSCSFRYGRGEFELDGVSLEVRAGEVLGIVGPNGSGKSTLLRLMSGILAPVRGEVLLGGASVRSVGRRRLARRLAFLPQSPEAPFRYSVREVVAMGRFPYQGAFGFLAEHDIEVVERALADTDCASLGDRDFSTLSGGEKQRVLIAGILAQEPAVMLLDEPTAALDIHHCCEVMDLLWGLSRRGIAVAAVTHDLNTAGQFCDRLTLLSGGRMVRSGAPAEVLQEDLLCGTYGSQVRVAANPFTGLPMVTVLGKAAHDAR
jgi:iron complex transport system ATP-binding protein